MSTMLDHLKDRCVRIWYEMKAAQGSLLMTMNCIFCIAWWSQCGTCNESRLREMGSIFVDFCHSISQRQSSYLPTGRGHSAQREISQHIDASRCSAAAACVADGTGWTYVSIQAPTCLPPYAHKTEYFSGSLDISSNLYNSDLLNQTWRDKYSIFRPTPGDCDSNHG